jgi:hypothetical protein
MINTNSSTPICSVVTPIMMIMTPKQVLNLFLLCKISAHCCFVLGLPHQMSVPLTNFLSTALHFHRFHRQLNYLNMPNLGGFLEAIVDFPSAGFV